MSDAYYEALSAQKLMQNELYLTLIYRPVVSGKRFAEKSSDVTRLQSEQNRPSPPSWSWPATSRRC
jgi:type IV secretion system protein VirB4